MESPIILVVGGDHAFCQELIRSLQFHEVKVVETQRQAPALRLFENRRPKLVLIVNPTQEHGREGLELVKMIRRQNEKVAIILVTRYSSEEYVISSLRAGVTDYFKYPHAFEELAASIKARLDGSERSSKLGAEDKILSFPGDRSMIGHSRSMREIKAYLSRIASTNATVLITGETGTGKGLAATLIHKMSPRNKKALVSVNCAALPDNLVESELFGYERGAFTGATTSKQGKFEMAEGGTIFLDEIGDMRPYAQAKILRTIEEKESYRLGGRMPIPLDVRVVTATNQDPERLVEEKRLRKDLYYRLNVARINMTPLRDRKEDIPRLVTHCIREMNQRFERHVECLTDEAMNHLLQYDWPGNVRELKNLLEVTFINVSSKKISLSDFPDEFRKRVLQIEKLHGKERDQILSALITTNWNKSEAARKLNWSRMTLYRKISKYNLENDPSSKISAQKV